MTEKEKEKLWCAEKVSYSKTFSLIAGHKVRVTDPDTSNITAVGYTSADNIIHISQNHPILDGLNEAGKRAFRCGVATHEFMHHMITDFTILRGAMNSYKNPVERKLFGHIQNYVEDARIEFFADYFIGGVYKKCLDFATFYTFQTTPEVQTGKEPIDQYLTALCMLGDMGTYKGYFTSEIAKECFDKTVPIFYKATRCANPYKIISYIKEIFEITRPLWIANAEEFEKKLDELKNATESRGKSMSSDAKSKPSSELEEDDEADSESTKRMRKTMEVSRREYEKMQNGNGGSGKNSGNGDSVKCKDAETAEEAAEAAEEAKEDAQLADGFAKEAEEVSDELNSENSSRINRAKERAKNAAERAEKAANEAAEHAEKSAEAKANGDETAEKEEAKAAGRSALKANAAMKTAERNLNDIYGNAQVSNAETAEDAQDACGEAQDAVEDAKDTVNESSDSSESSESNNSDGDSKKKSNAKKELEKAEEALEKAKEAAQEAKEAAESGDEAAEKAAAKRAESEANKAKRAAERAESIMNGEDNSDYDSSARTNTTGQYNSSGDQDGAYKRAQDGFTPEMNIDPDAELEDEYDGEVTDIDSRDYELTDADMNAIEQEVTECLKEVEKEEKERAEGDAEIMPDFNITSARIGNARTCLNQKIKIGDAERAETEYARLLEKLRPGINSLYSRLKNIFANDLEVKDYRASGKLNYDRLNNGRMTARVFEKRRLPAEKSQAAICILVDESGSMCGKKADTAKQAAIAFAETFARLDIPIYIMGFTADVQQYDAWHNHYLTWRNTHSDRLRLLNIAANSDNFDGYSIRYGTEILKRINAEHKLMIVISDGSPACYSYRGGNEGVADTKDAIIKAKSQFDVLGVLVGTSDVNTIHAMYGNDFVNVSNITDLFADIAKRIVRIVNKWE